MGTKSLDEAFRNLNGQLVSVERTTRSLTSKFENLSRGAELLKLGVLERVLENKRVSQARLLGLTAMMRDNRKLGIGLALAVGQSLLQRAVSKDNSGSLRAGISGFNDFAQGLGYSRWGVSLDKQFIVVPEDEIFSGRVWVTWESLRSALVELKQDTIGGEKLGNLDGVIAKLRQKKHILVHLFTPVVETSQSQWHPISN